MKKVALLNFGGTIIATPGKDGKLGHFGEGWKWRERVPEVDHLANLETITEKEDAIDSTEMETSHRAKMAQLLYDNRNQFDGFLILQGTDTMTDTAAALNYMLQDFGKPVIITGAQKSLFEQESDARGNIIRAIRTATSELGETAIVFDGDILRAARTIKIDAEGYHAFTSPRSKLLGTAHITKAYISNEARKRHEEKPKIFTEFDTGVFLFEQVSGAQNEHILDKIVKDDAINGIIIGGFGSGNVHPKYAGSIREATRRGKPTFIALNCEKGGGNPDAYDINSRALDAGAASLYDMTKPAALQKLMYALGKTRRLEGEPRIREVKRIMLSPIGKDITAF